MQSNTGKKKYFYKIFFRRHFPIFKHTFNLMWCRSIFGGANGIMGTAKQLVSLGLSLPIPQSPVARKRNSRLNFVRLTLQSTAIRAALSIDEIPPNALRQARESGLSSCGFSLGVDLGLSRTGLALSKGFSFRPLTVKYLCAFAPNHRYIWTVYVPVFVPIYILI